MRIDWANIWRRPEPDEERKRLAATVRRVSAEKRDVQGALDDAERKARRLADQLSVVERQLESTQRELRGRESEIELLQKERKALIGVIETLQVYQEHAAKMKLAEIATAEERARHGRIMRGDEP